MKAYLLGLLLVASCAQPALAQVASRDDTPGVPAVVPYITAGGRQVQIMAVVPIDPATGLAAASGSASGGVTRGAVTDGSGTVTAGGATQQAIAASATRSYLMCQNPVTATETLFVNIGAAASTAGGSIELAPGASVAFSDSFIPTGAVNVTAATSAHRFICKAG